MVVKEFKPFDFFYALFITSFFLFTLSSIDGKKRNEAFKPACFRAPIYVYNEDMKKYYRQDWCHIGSEPIYFDSIPVPSNGERGIA